MKASWKALIGLLRKNYGPKLFRGLEPALLSILENAIEAFRTKPLWILGSWLSSFGKAFSQNGYEELGTTVATMLTRMVLTVPGFRLGDGDRHDKINMIVWIMGVDFRSPSAEIGRAIVAGNLVAARELLVSITPPNPLVLVVLEEAERLQAASIQDRT